MFLPFAIIINSYQNQIRYLRASRQRHLADALVFIEQISLIKEKEVETLTKESMMMFERRMKQFLEKANNWKDLDEFFNLRILL